MATSQMAKEELFSRLEMSTRETILMGNLKEKEYFGMWMALRMKDYGKTENNVVKA